MNMKRLLLSKLITFQLPAVKILLADLQAIPLQLLFPQLNIVAVHRLLLHKQQFQIVLFHSFTLENDRTSFCWKVYSTLVLFEINSRQRRSINFMRVWCSVAKFTWKLSKS